MVTCSGLELGEESRLGTEAGDLLTRSLVVISNRRVCVSPVRRVIGKGGARVSDLPGT